ncbi:MAG: hypothetical protein QNJ44_07035 [Rhodobacter sp.]|nr:hypothetical protein [Rhodobacter sp.]
MWRNLICAAAFCAAGSAAAQDSLDEMLAASSVFDCTAGEARTVYVFHSDEDGTVTRLGDSAGSVAALAGLPDDLREIAGTRYLAFQGADATPGTCLAVTEIARGIYPAVTAGFLPDVDLGDTGEADAADLAAAVTIRDQRARLADEEAGRLAAERHNRTLQTALAEAEVAHRAAETEIAALQAALAAAEAGIAALNTEVAALQGRVDGLTGELDRETAARMELAALAREVQVRLAETAAALQSSETDRRATVASAAYLGQRTVSLEGELRGALDDAEDARTRTEAMQNLADAAVLRIASMQERDPDSVRAEVCLFLRGERPELCR